MTARRVMLRVAGDTGHVSLAHPLAEPGHDGRGYTVAVEDCPEDRPIADVRRTFAQRVISGPLSRTGYRVSWPKLAALPVGGILRLEAGP